KGRGKAAITYADGHLYMRHSDGIVSLAEANPEKFVDKGSFRIPGYRRASGSTFPVIAGGRLYIRDNDRLFCYDIREGALQQPRPEPKTIVLAKPKAQPKRDRFAERISKKGNNRAPDSIFLSTPQDVVVKMLEAANLKKGDVVYDLGSGDGRIVLTAANKFGCKAYGVELDRELVKLSQENIKKKKLENLASIERKDMFTVDLSKANVVTVFQYSRLLEKLMPQFAQMKPGSRIVSHQFEIPDVTPEKDITIESKETGDKHRILLYTTPLKKRATTD
ncbi:MAG: methyltransferase domain-containing protein, partial [Planctomycetes bacterium]|nr:methyltransferase domain-containing protein [Planctomycetota bacterium]